MADVLGVSDQDIKAVFLVGGPTGTTGVVVNTGQPRGVELADDEAVYKFTDTDGDDWSVRASTVSAVKAV